MIHAREDYNGVQDTTGHTSIKDDEPVFLLRAKDKLAPTVIRYWADMLKALGGDIATAEHIIKWADKMVAWQIDNNCHLPDTPQDVMVKDK
jgi:hypothetical protein